MNEAECERLRALLRGAAASLAWDHHPDADSECGGCQTLAEIVDVLGLDPERLI